MKHKKIKPYRKFLQKESTVTGFPKWGLLAGGKKLENMVKNCMKITDSRFTVI